MDVTCAQCGEPWDTYHMRHDEVYETEAGLQIIEDQLDQEDWDKEKMCRFSPQQQKAFKFTAPNPRYVGEQWEGKLTNFWTKQFAMRGWKFGGSVYAISQCPFCKDAKALPNALDRIAERKCIVDILDGDEDGIAVTIADL